MRDLDLASITLMSLKSSDIMMVKDLLISLAGDIELKIQEKVLLKSQLRGFSFEETSDLLILEHRAEGRLLLTDRNGFYNDLLSSAYRVLEGRVLVIIVNIENDPPEGALVSSEIYELAKYGDQPTIGVLAEMGKVVCFKSKPSCFQISHINSVIMKAAFFREPPDYAKLPDSYQPGGKVFKCPLL